MNRIVLIIILLAFVNVSNIKALPDEAIDFTVTDINGKVHNLFDYLDDGKFVFLNFFHTGCDNCETDIPAINNIYVSFGCNQEDLIVIGIETSTTNDSILNVYKQEQGIIFPLVSGLNGGGANVDTLYGIDNYPTYILIKPDSTLIETSVSIAVIEAEGVSLNECDGVMPKAKFAANQTLILVGQSINFTDLSTGNPWMWEWTFWGANPESSDIQHPTEITYNTEGFFDVQMIILSNYGYDTVLYENYIQVISDIGDEAPIAKFTGSNRLLKVGNYATFTDLSENYPTQWYWQFQGGEPVSSTAQNLPEGVRYDNPGYFDVSLIVYNENGQSLMQRKDYIIAYENFVGKICDDITNLKQGETPKAMTANGITGYYGGQNSEQIRAYADYYDYHTYNKIYGVTIPIVKINYTHSNAYINIIVWEGSDKLPTEELYSKRVYLKDLKQNFSQTIMFDNPAEIEGSFYLGYSINYGSGQEFVVGLADNRGTSGFNSLFVKKDNLWYNSRTEYEISTSTGIIAITCLVGIDDNFIKNNLNIYPNPSKDIVYIEYENFFNKGDFAELYDNMGRVLMHQSVETFSNQITLNVSDINNGIYYLRIFIDGTLIVEKISVMK